MLYYTHLPFMFLTLICEPLPGIQTEASTSIQLPEPETEGGIPLMNALKQRKSSRQFSNRELPRQLLSNLLWAAWGINRPDGRRTAPSALNKQEIDLYVILKEGAFLYDAESHALKIVTDADLREQAGTQDYVREAPANLIYVANTSRMASDESTWILYYGASAGAIAQNVYLFCASEDLAAVIRASVDRDALAKALSLTPDQRIALAQSVGYPP
jgi:nitroreductase